MFLKDHEFALITDEHRKWVLAVATRGDLEVSGLGMLRAAGRDNAQGGAADLCAAEGRRRVLRGIFGHIRRTRA